MAQYLTKKQLVSDFIEDRGISPADSDIPTFKKWAGDAMDQLEVYETWEDAVELIKIKDYVAIKPKDARAICEIAARKKTKNDKDEARIIGYQITQWKQQLGDEGCELEINLLCRSCKKTKCNCNSPGYSLDIDRVFLDANPEIEHKHMLGYQGVHRFGYGKSCHHPEFKLLKPINDPWNMIKHIPKCANVMCTDKCTDTYQIKKSVIDTNIKEGWMLVSYLKGCADENSEAVLPTRPIHGVKAVAEYLAYMYYRREYGRTFEAPLLRIAETAEQKWLDYMADYLSEVMNNDLTWLFGYLQNSVPNQIDDSYQALLDGKVPPTYNSEYNSKF